MTGLVLRMDHALYPGVQKNWDDELFRACVLKAVHPEDEILDLGAGAGIVSQLNFLGAAKRVCGIDPDERVTKNPCLNEGRIGVGENIPYPIGTFDIVFSANVVEHLANPRAVLLEVRRVLKPQGRFLFKTPNRWHYMPVIAQVTPTRFHKFFNRLRGRSAVDTFPTRYRMNSGGAIRRLASRCGFRVVSLQYLEGRPEYLRFSALTYAVGAAYERLTNRVRFLEKLRWSSSASFRRCESGEGVSAPSVSQSMTLNTLHLFLSLGIVERTEQPGRESGERRDRRAGGDRPAPRLIRAQLSRGVAAFERDRGRHHPLGLAGRPR
jgi:SAM-dependent methyltransferase